MKISNRKQSVLHFDHTRWCMATTEYLYTGQIAINPEVNDVEAMAT